MNQVKDLRKSKRPTDWPKSGWYWFLHHDEKLEYTHDIDERWDFVCANKPYEELSVRLVAMRPVVGMFPQELTAALDKYKAAGDKYEAALDKYFAARDKYKAAEDKYNTARDKYKAARAKYQPEIDTLFAAECADAPWDGESLIWEEE